MFELSFFFDNGDWRIPKIKAAFFAHRTLLEMLEEHYALSDQPASSDMFTRQLNYKITCQEKRIKKLKSALTLADQIKIHLLKAEDLSKLEKCIEVPLSEGSAYWNQDIVHRAYSEYKYHGWHPNKLPFRFEVNKLFV